MKWTGLTGGIATGKSTAKKLIEGLGFPVIDADLVSHEVTKTHQIGYQKIVSQFGSGILNSDLSIDRKKLASIIFNDLQQKQTLEAILHPLIQQEVQKQKEFYQQQNAKICFYDVPLLFEKNLVSQFDFNILVWCNSQTQLQRLMKRNNLTKEEALLRIKNQMNLIDKVKQAQFCLDNSGEESDLKKQIVKLVEKLIS